MGKLALAAKITHVPSMYLSEFDGPRKDTRKAAIDGHKEIGRRCRELGVDTIVVFDTHWLVNANYHVNCAPHFKGLYTSNELPHFISNMGYEFPGNPALGQLLAKTANGLGVETLYGLDGRMVTIQELPALPDLGEPEESWLVDGVRLMAWHQGEVGLVLMSELAVGRVRAFGSTMPPGQLLALLAWGVRAEGR